jgi:RNA polymerase sigma factor (sigma-70 family)
MHIPHSEARACSPAGEGGGGFPATRLSVVRGASSADAGVRQRALETLATAYWKPVYKHIRLRSRRSAEDAEDLTQAFFARAVEKDFFAGYDPAKGRFRTFLRSCLDRFLANEDKAASRLKRGGDTTVLHLDFASAEEELGAASAGNARTPEEAFDAEWSRSVFSMAIGALRRQCDAQGKELHFRLFSRYDLETDGPGRPTYEALASELGTTASQVTNHLAWARREFRRLVLETLRSLTGSDEEFRLEARVLLGFDPGDHPAGGTSQGTPC